MEYAGFWKRSWAGGIDVLVLLPFWYLCVTLGDLSKELAIVIGIIHPAMYWFYNISFHGKWGATLGKMALKIKVVKERDGTNISFKESFLRFSVDLVFAIIAIIAYMIALESLSASEFSSLNRRERGEVIVNHWPEWRYYTNILSMVWGVSELLVLLLNKRKRAIHDFIAGTVVIYTGKKKKKKAGKYYPTDLYKYPVKMP